MDRAGRSALACALAWTVAPLLAACHQAQPARTTTISGRVVGLGPGDVPIAGRRVAAASGGAWATTTSAGDGTFSLQVESVPYALAVDSSVRAGLWVYLGVSRTDPVLRVSGSPSYPPLKMGALEGSIAAVCSGAGCSATGGIVGFEFGAGGDYLVPLLLPPGAGAEPYTVQAAWQGPDRLPGRLHALTWDAPAAPGPVPTWCATVTAEAVFGGTSRVDVPALQPCATAATPVTVLGPAATASTLLVDHGIVDIPYEGSGWSWPLAGSTSLVDVPTGSEFRTSIRATGQAASGEVFWVRAAPVAAGGTGLTLTYRLAPAALEPAEGSVVGAGTRFAWTPAGGLYRLTLGPIELTTAASELRLPDLAALGYGYLSGLGDSWTVTASGPEADVDAVLAPAAPGAPESWGSTSAPRPFVFR